MSLKQHKENNSIILKQTREKINRFTTCSRQTHSQLQPIVLNIEKGRLFEPRARLFEPQEINFQFSAGNKAIFNNRSVEDLIFSNNIWQQSPEIPAEAMIIIQYCVIVWHSILMCKYTLPADPTSSTLVLLRHLIYVSFSCQSL